MLWQILVQFLFRLATGLAAAMAWTSPRWVTAGFFRVHLWVTLGLNTFGAMVMLMLPDFPRRSSLLGLSIAGAIGSYIGAVIWLYEKPRPGRIALGVVAAINAAGALVAAAPESAGRAFGLPSVAVAAEALSASLLLGATFTAMLLGHWYLNTPTMKLVPLQRLVLMMGAAVLLRSLVCLDEFWGAPGAVEQAASTYYVFLSLRWLAGLIGVLGLTAMTWQTLKIPNTQSATGILYVAVIFVFLGELTSQLLLVGAPQSV